MTDETPAPEPTDDDLIRASKRELLGPMDFQNVEAEAALLGALMIENRLVGDVSAQVKPDDFFEPVHARIYKAIVRLVENAKLATPVTLKPLFDRDLGMKELGGPSYMAQLTGSGAGLIGARQFALQISELARMRRLYGAMIESIREMQDSGDLGASIDKLEREIWAAADTYRPIKIHSIGGMVGLAQKRQDRLAQNPGKTGVTSRTVPEINSLAGGLEGEQYTIVAGRPSMGKTTAAVSFSWGAAANGHCTSYLHAEMSAEMMGLKVATDVAHAFGTPLPFKGVRDGTLSRAQLDQLQRAREQADLLPMRFADIGRMEVTRLESVVAREVAYWAARDRKLELVVLDYIGLIAVADARPGDDRARVSRVSKALMDISKKYKLHVMALAQLSRKVEDRPDRRPMMSDLRDSGDLEQDADNVIFVHRPEFYLIDEKPKPGMKNFDQANTDWQIEWAEWENKVEIIGSKTRFGSRGARRARFYGEHSAVRSLTYRHPEEDGGEDLFSVGGM